MFDPAKIISALTNPAVKAEILKDAADVKEFTAEVQAAVSGLTKLIDDAKALYAHFSG